MKKEEKKKKEQNWTEAIKPQNIDLYLRLKVSLYDLLSNETEIKNSDINNTGSFHYLRAWWTYGILFTETELQENPAISS